MNHTFIKALDGTDKCAKCKFPELSHGNEATCEVCPNKGPVEIRYGNILMCESCWIKEQTTLREIMKPENQQRRVDAMHAAMDASRSIDAKVQVREDLFNSATVSIIELKKIIDENPAITNKPYALAEELRNRFETFKRAIFEANEKVIEATNNQKAIQVYLNTLANQLRQEEREKLKLSDINYKPTEHHPRQTKAPTIRKPSFNKIEIARYAKELGVSEFTLQMLCVAKGIPVEAAAKLLKQSLKVAKGEN
ncbi:hypothetical protein L0244_31720 [bacterium]|nr:hypothetical protein [bacterium]